MRLLPRAPPPSPPPPSFPSFMLSRAHQYMLVSLILGDRNLRIRQAQATALELGVAHRAEYIAQDFSTIDPMWLISRVTKIYLFIVSRQLAVRYTHTYILSFNFHLPPYNSLNFSFDISVSLTLGLFFSFYFFFLCLLCHVTGSCIKGFIVGLGCCRHTHYIICV